MKTKAIQLCIITAARNEEEYLPKLISSIINQERQPDHWYIIDDGSSDKTYELIQDVEKKYTWISGIHRQDRGFYSRNQGVIDSLQLGFNKAQYEFHPDILGIVDADITLESTAFQKVVAEFAKTPKLGILGAEILERKNNKWTVPVILPLDFVRGACKFYRSTCYEKMQKIHSTKGWNAVENMYAEMLGWTVQRHQSVYAKHYRPKGKRDGIFDHKRAAENAYYINSDNFLVIARSLRRMISEKPYILGGIVFLTTYFLNKLLQKPQLPNRQLLDYVRKRHKEILWEGYFNW